jgi:mannose-1-phosphate guanylyltransferase
MAGGAGTRFWPLSRESRPKQFLPLLGRRSLIEETASRLTRILPWERVVVVATRGQAALVEEALPHLPNRNLLLEPAGRNTGPCLALAASYLMARDPDSVMVALPADHFIAPVEPFCDAVRAAAQLAVESEDVVTIGVKPTWPATGYGYLEAGLPLRSIGGCVTRPLTAFHEKPSAERAAAYVRGGNYFWNAGIFILTVSCTLRLFERHAPPLALLTTSVVRAEGESELTKVLERAYAELIPVSFDSAVMERHGEGFLVEADFAWSDVGSWDSMAERWEDRAGNRLAGDVLSVGASDCAIYSSGRLVAAVGVEDLVIVEAPDAVLVCSKGETQRVREVVARLREEGRTELL